MTEFRLEGEGLVQRRLPWLVAVVAFLVYAVTLEKSSTFAGIASLAKNAGWDWHPNLVAPLHVCLTYAVRWLPATAQLICLNLTAAVAAALTLALLARSVSLLPHDRTRMQRRIVQSPGATLDLRFAWLPPLVAVMVCAFQRSFWENAIVATGETLDLLLFAWLINSLLEYRLEQKQKRLLRFAFVYGLAVTNNFAMLGFLPAFFIALLWIKGRTFFRFGFLWRFAASGAAGLLLYLVSPLLHFLSAPDSHSFGEMLRGYLGFQKHNLLAFPRYVILLCGLTSLFPLLLIGIRWPSRFGEVSRLGATLTNCAGHLIHLTFLIACTWVAFDPLFSPRHLSRQLSAMLPFYYLGALVVGYCLGYVLIAVNDAALRAAERASRLGWIACNIVAIVICAAAGVVPAGLCLRSVRAMRANFNGQLASLLREAARSVPPEASVVLGDDLFYLYGLEHELQKRNPRHQNILIDTTAFSSPEYHRFLQKKYAGRWPAFVNAPPKNVPIEPANLINVILQVGERMPLFYLHPSYGYYFEFLYAKPSQLLYQLFPYPHSAVSAPPLTAEEITRQDQYWSALKQESQLAPFLANPPTVSTAEHPRTEDLRFERYLRGVYSRALNDFGVALQRSGALEPAGEYYRLSVLASPSNAIAAANQSFNQRLRQKQEAVLELDEATAQQLKARDNRWELLLKDFGPTDTPMSCYRLAQAFAAGGNYRQAAQQLERTLFFAPDHRSARLDYMMMCVRMRLPEKAAAELSNYRGRFSRTPLPDGEEVELVRVEAWVSLLHTNLPAAEKLLLEAQSKYPEQTLPWDTLVDIYLQLGQQTNALAVLRKQLAAQPRNVRALVNYAGLKMKTGDIEGALSFLEQALEYKPDDEDGLFNRALALSGLGRFEPAQRDFLALLAHGTSTYRLQSYLGLGEVYYRLRKPKESMRYYTDFLKNAGPGAPGVDLARERLKLLKQQGHSPGRGG